MLWPSLKTGSRANPLAIPPDAVGRGSPIGFEVVPDDAALISRFAADMMGEYRAAKAAGRDRVVFIVPVGPVGQYPLWAAACNETGTSLSDLVLVNMDEYLTEDGSDFIPLSDPLSFRAHMQREFFSLLDPALSPPEEARIFPDPRRPEATTELIDRLGGVDACFGGVGITGHLAFNDPPEPGDETGLEEFAALPTRIVRLSRETRVNNAITAARGSIDRVPELAVTVGMREILGARRVRLYMNRPWQCAIVRKLLHGPVTAAVPASLLQRHPDARVTALDLVTALPEPELR
ncbi:glucosamine-6-phosphate isomerase [Afifella sp. IM 167]|uniref:glucosamine-6-phosphate isomerase n=1 Tax=Afifella sp. IM 167 TaxID=2033586 RepID=UPI001CCF69CA|nr:glucosamine-6-phosphate isomerase [Afifella sp. IM 167]MBZ8134959.1 glucosamine-6-phosphate isomerase [Afifella sp. IM 167]